MSDQRAADEMSAVLANLRDPGPAVRTANCPEETQWFEVAAGSLGDEVATKLLGHAGECFYCSRLLNAAQRVFSDDPQPGEDQVVAGERFARVVAREKPWLRTVGWFRRLRIAPVGSLRWLPVAAMVLAAVWFGVPQFAQQHAATLVAQAEARTRFSSFRFSGAPYAPTDITRKSAKSTDVPVPVLEAARWIRWAGKGSEATLLQARIALAEGDTAQSPERIQEVLNERGPTPELLNDLATAWAALAEKNRDAASAERALQAVDLALAKAPSFPEALFNRALILNLLNRPQQACAALAAYRVAENDPRWRDEVAARLFCGK